MRIGKFRTRKTCRLCDSSKLSPFLNMGLLPLAGEFLNKKEIGKEKYYPLRVFFCRNCYLVQLLDIPINVKIFEDYRYLSSISLTEHFKEYANEMSERYLTKKDFIVEIGSNDGVLLLPLKEKGFKVLGVDPAKNIAKIAQKNGIKTIIDYFGPKVAKKIVDKYGKADAIFANNVLAHIDDMKNVASGVSQLLKRDGILVIEIHYLPDLINNLQYDFFYPGEHLTYYSIGPLSIFWEKYGFNIFKIKKTSMHSGAIRVYLKKTKTKNSVVDEYIKSEKRGGIYSEKRLKQFAKDVKKHKSDFIKKIKEISEAGTIVGYGAAGRGNTLLNYAKIGREIIPYIVDESPERYGRFTPGNHIPIYKPSFFRENYPSFCLILAWSYADRIINKESEFKRRGGKFLVPLPKIVVK